MTDRDKILATALLMGDTPIVKKRSIEIPAWGRRFRTDEFTGDITAVQEMCPYVDTLGNHRQKYVTVARG